MGIKSTVTSAVQTATGKIGGFVTAISTRTGAPKALVGTLMAATLVGTIGVGGAVMNNHEVEHNQYWIGEEECENYIQAELNKNNTDGEVTEIPSDVTTGGYTVTRYDEQGFYLGHNAAGVAAGTGQEAVHNLWNKKGSVYDDDIATIDGCFLIAMRTHDDDESNSNTKTGFPNVYVGSVITFVLANGDSFDAVVADSKNGQDENATSWGHGTDGSGGEPINVIEFETRPFVDETRGNPGLPGDWHPELGYGDVRKIINHGIHPDLVSELGIVGAATANMSSLGNKSAADAMDECQADRGYDNSTLAAALASYSMSRSTHQSDSEESSPIYQEVCDGIWENGAKNCTAGYHYHSCDTGVSTAVHWTGADLDFPAVGPASQYTHCAESPLWEIVAEDGKVGTDLTDEKAESSGLEPGDVGITLGDHILAYVGEDAVENAWEQVIKGLSGADVGEPEDGACMVSASAHERGANIHAGYGDDRSYQWFRYIGDYPDKDKYKDLGSSATLSSASVKGTKCDCLECGPEEEEEEPSDIIEWAKKFEGQDYCWGGGHSAEQTCPDETPDGFHGPKGHSGAKVGYSLREAHPCDCSGLVTSCYYLSGIDITEATGGNNATGGMQSDVGTFWKEVSDSEAKAGDIILTSGHVMLYAGKNDNGSDYIIHEIYAGCTEEEVSAPSERGQVLHWIGPTGNAASGTDTASSSTKKSANTGNEDCGQKCFDSGKFDDTFLVGDSVSAGAKDDLLEAMPGITVDADPNRSYEEGGANQGGPDYGGIDIARKQAGKYDRYVVEIGINDCGTTYEMCKEFMKVLGKSNTQVFFVNQHVSAPDSYNQTTDESIDKIVAEYNNAFKVDWYSVAKAHPEYLSDGCHLNSPDGTKAFATCIKEAMSKNAGCTTSSNDDPNDHGTGAWHKNSMSMYTIADNDPPGSTATASGIPLDDNGLTCAIPMTTPNCSSYYGKKLELKIGDKTCTVTITDCGGFGSYGGPGGPRRIDATKGVFSKLGVAGEGLVAVEWRGVDLTEQQVNDLAA